VKIPVMVTVFCLAEVLCVLTQLIKLLIAANYMPSLRYM